MNDVVTAAAGSKLAAAKRLVWTCQECGKPIADDAGYVVLSLAEMREHRRLNEELDRKYPQVDEQGNPSFQFISLAEIPYPAAWHALHAKCDQDPEEESWYWFDVHRIRTLEQLCAWTIHLSEKGWYGETDWSLVAHGRLTSLGFPAYSVMA